MPQLKSDAFHFSYGLAVVNLRASGYLMRYNCWIGKWFYILDLNGWVNDVFGECVIRVRNGKFGWWQLGASAAATAVDGRIEIAL